MKDIVDKNFLGKLKTSNNFFVNVSYYYLVNGDTINKGDEFQSLDEKWRLTGQANEVFTINDHYPHRRRN
tara:strand:+ start:250 stop:459 length:210 start_codon:yes stop_codon:yes gene_type:complete